MLSDQSPRKAMGGEVPVPTTSMGESLELLTKAPLDSSPHWPSLLRTVGNDRSWPSCIAMHDGHYA